MKWHKLSNISENTVWKFVCPHSPPFAISPSYCHFHSYSVPEDASVVLLPQLYIPQLSIVQHDMTLKGTPDALVFRYLPRIFVAVHKLQMQLRVRLPCIYADAILCTCKHLLLLHAQKYKTCNDIESSTSNYRLGSGWKLTDPPERHAKAPAEAPTSQSQAKS